MDAPREAFVDYEKDRLVKKGGKSKTHLTFFLGEMETGSSPD
jgi:hypothetical protein